MARDKESLLPSGSCGLTANPTDDFDAKQGWIELGSQSTKATAAGFWHVIRSFTREQHWNKTIFEVCVTAEEVVEYLGTEEGKECDSIKSHAESWYGQHTPKPGFRLNVMRTLSRKTPAPIGGGSDGSGLTYKADEWTAQYIKTVARETGNAEHLHTAVFGLVVPENVCGPENPRALRYWPFQYPKVACYRFTYEADADGKEGGVLRYSVIPLGEDAACPRNFESLKVHSVKSAAKMLSVLRKRAETYDPTTGGSTYVKRVKHDNLLTEIEYRTRYDAMKLKYMFWVEQWTECTDPVKFVYEELGIAAYLCALWDKERAEEGLKRKQSFIDCGCGNGFLVYLLIMEGHEGIGVDLQKRGIWSKYPAKVSAALYHEEMDPLSYDCSKYDWILGNHSDELSPWIPVLAARAQKTINARPVCEVDSSTLNGGDMDRELRRAYPRFFVLPCCFFDFDGKKVAFGKTRRTVGVRAVHGTGKYEQYCMWIAQLSKTFGFSTQIENLRIPSTKYVSLLGRYVAYEERISPKVVKEMTSLLLLDAKQSHM